MNRSSQKLEESQASSRIEYESFRKRFDEACTKIAVNYQLFYSNGKPRKAQIIEIIAKTACTCCIDKLLHKKSSNIVDNFYTECHLLACNILVEELQARLSEKGYSVLITDEKKLEYGRVDILIVPNRHGIDLYSDKKEVGIEVKTGKSLSLSQLFRYMLDNTDRILILWRIRNRQILLFEGTKLKPLLTQFMKMIISRAERLLSNQEIPCEHALNYNNWSPNQHQLQEAFSDFSRSVIDTLPAIVESVTSMLDGEPNSNRK